MEVGGNGKEGLLVGSLFNLHGRKLSWMTGCLRWGIQIQEEGQRRYSLKGSWKAAGQFWVSRGNTEVCSGCKNKGLRDGA